MYDYRQKYALVSLLSCYLMLLPGVLALGCLDDNDICGDEMEIVDNKCAPKSDDGADGGTESSKGADATVVTDAETVDDSGDDLPAGMGNACTGEGDCTMDADYCAIVPGASEGSCTIQNCTVTPDDCPTGYHCLDLSVFAPGLPTICEIDEG